MTVSYNLKNSNDWFRDFLFPETILKIERAISPLRKNAGKLIILDGRINQRQWGRDLVKMIKPSKEIKYMFPFE